MTFIQRSKPGSSTPISRKTQCTPTQCRGVSPGPALRGPAHPHPTPRQQSRPHSIRGKAGAGGRPGGGFMEFVSHGAGPERRGGRRRGPGQTGTRAGGRRQAQAGAPGEQALGEGRTNWIRIAGSLITTSSKAGAGPAGHIPSSPQPRLPGLSFPRCTGGSVPLRRPEMEQGTPRPQPRGTTPRFPASPTASRQSTPMLVRAHTVQARPALRSGCRPPTPPGPHPKLLYPRGAP